VSTDNALVRLEFELITTGDTKTLSALASVVRAYSEVDKQTAKVAAAQAAGQRAAAAASRGLQGLSASARGNTQAWGNLGYQLNDVFSMMSAGTDPMRAIGVQLPQLLQGFGALGIAASVGAAALPMLWGAMNDTEKEAEETKKEIDSLVDALRSLKQAQEDAATGPGPTAQLALMTAEREAAANAAEQYDRLAAALNKVLTVEEERKARGGLNAVTLGAAAGGGASWEDLVRMTEAMEAAALAERKIAAAGSEGAADRLRDILDSLGGFEDITVRQIDDAQKALSALIATVPADGELGHAMKDMLTTLVALGEIKSKPIDEFAESVRSALDPLRELAELRERLKQAVDEGRLSQGDADAYFADQTRPKDKKKSAKEDNAREREIEQLRRQAQAIKELLNPMEKYYVQEALVHQLLSSGLLTRQQATDALAHYRAEVDKAANAEAKRLQDEERRLQEEMERAGRDARKAALADWERGDERMVQLERELEGIRAAAEQGAIAMEDAKGRISEVRTEMASLTYEQELASQYSDVLTNGFNRMFDEIARGAQNMNDVFKNVVKSIIAELLKIVLMQAVIAAFGGPTSKLGGRLSKGFGFTPKALGGAYDGAGNEVSYFARGGVVSSPTMFGYSGGLGIMGEAGPEAIMPLKRNRNGELGVKSPVPMVNVVVNNNAGVDVSTSISPDGGLTLDIVRRAISNDIQRGGSSVSRAMERTYGVGRGR